MKFLTSLFLCFLSLAAFGADGYLARTNGNIVIGPGGSGGSQTPWTSDINGGGFQLTNAGNLVSTGNITAGGSGHYLAATNGGSYGNYGTGATNTDGFQTSGTITGATVTATGFFEGSGAHLTGLPSSGIPQNSGFGTNTTIYGDSNKTNALVVFPGGEIASNAVGTVTIGSGAVAASGNITSTNGQFVGNGAGLTNLPTTMFGGASVNVNGTTTNYFPLNGINNSTSVNQSTNWASSFNRIVTISYLNIRIGTAPLTGTNIIYSILTNDVVAAGCTLIGNGTSFGTNVVFSPAINIPANTLIGFSLISGSALGTLVHTWSFGN